MGNQTRDGAASTPNHRDRTDRNWDCPGWRAIRRRPRRPTRLGLAQKTRSPNLYERYTWSTWQMAAFMNNFVGDGNGYFGDIDLKPEVARTAEPHRRLARCRRRHGASASRPTTPTSTDYIDAVQWNSTSNVPRTVPVADNFRCCAMSTSPPTLYGIDLSGHGRLASSTATAISPPGRRRSYARGENRDTDDNLYNIMPLNATLSLTQKLGAWRNTIEGEFVAAKDDVSQVRNEMETAGYGLVQPAQPL